VVPHPKTNKQTKQKQKNRERKKGRKKERREEEENFPLYKPDGVTGYRNN
jgi:hypothetical protein